MNKKSAITILVILNILVVKIGLICLHYVVIFAVKKANSKKQQSYFLTPVNTCYIGCTD